MYDRRELLQLSRDVIVYEPTADLSEGPGTLR